MTATVGKPKLTITWTRDETGPAGVSATVETVDGAATHIDLEYSDYLIDAVMKVAEGLGAELVEVTQQQSRQPVEFDDDEEEEEEPKICVDCGADTAPCKAAAAWDPCPEGCDHTGTWEWYAVLDVIWAEVGGPPTLCIGCLERRLGRPLTAADFADLPINEPARCDSPRLTAARNRVGGNDTGETDAAGGVL
jgi:hypothetical protein